MLKYPILIRAAAFAQDETMQQIFDDFATGSPMKGVLFHNECIVCTLPKKHFVYSINETMDPQSVYNELSQILKERFPELFLKQYESPSVTSIVPETWQELRRKHIKDALLYRYVKSQDVDDCAQAVEYLRTLLVLRLLTPKDITLDLETRDIVNINGIEVDPHTRTLCFSEERIASPSNEAFTFEFTMTLPAAKKLVPINVTTGWTSYLNDLITHTIKDINKNGNTDA